MRDFDSVFGELAADPKAARDVIPISSLNDHPAQRRVGHERRGADRVGRFFIRVVVLARDYLAGWCTVPYRPTPAGLPGREPRGRVSANSRQAIRLVTEKDVRDFFHQRGANATFDRTMCDLQRTSARLFYLGYLLLLDQLDIFDATGRSEASRLLESASEAGMITAVDLVSAEKPEYGNLVSAALPFTDHLLLNELEASKVLGLRICPETADELLAAAEKILAGGVRQTVTIHTTRGAVCVSTNAETVIQPSLKLPEGYVCGSTGAGDAFAAGYLHGIHECLPLFHCLYIAVCTAAASLRHPSPSAGIDAVEDCLALGKRFGLADFH